MKETGWERWGAASGFAAVVVGAVAMVFERGPVTPNDPANTVTAHFTDNHGSILAQSMLFLASGAIYLWFVGSLRSFLIRAEGGTGRVSTVVFGAGLTWVGINMVAQAFQIGFAMAPRPGAPPALIATMNAVFTTAALPLAVMLTAVAVVAFRHHAFPAWLGWLAATAAATQLVLWYGSVVDSGPLASDGWLSYVLYPVVVVWLIPTTVVMIRRIGQPPSATILHTPQQRVDRTRESIG